MAFFGRKSSPSSGGFTNKRTGKYVSPTRAHQHTGQTISGFTKVKSQKTGNYYMKPTRKGR